MTKEEFVKEMNEIIESGKAAAVYVKKYGNEDFEITIIGNKDLKSKLEYYCAAYDEDMIHKYTGGDISIQDVTPVIVNEIPVGEKTVKIFMYI